jgi:hypothetical protein
MLLKLNTNQPAPTAAPKAVAAAAVAFRHAADLLRHEVRLGGSEKPGDWPQELILGRSCVEMLDETDEVLRGLLRRSAVDAGQASDRLALHCLELYLASLWARRLADDATPERPDVLARRLHSVAVRLGFLIEQLDSM